MTPKEKSDELVLKMLRIHNNIDWFHKDLAKQCALIAVNEILFTLNEISEEDNSTYAYHTAVFYNQVKTLIKNL